LHPAPESPRRGVAPFTGAWIETTIIRQQLRSTLVAPFTGAWIETPPLWRAKPLNSRRAFHGRVDRNAQSVAAATFPNRRAFHGRVDRNFSKSDKKFNPSGSRLSRARGSKRPDCQSLRHLGAVAPFTGAWIETFCGLFDGHLLSRRAFHGRVDRNKPVGGKPKSVLRRAFHGRVDRNSRRQSF